MVRLNRLATTADVEFSTTALNSFVNFCLFVIDRRLVIPSSARFRASTRLRIPSISASVASGIFPKSFSSFLVQSRRGRHLRRGSRPRERRFHRTASTLTSNRSAISRSGTVPSKATMLSGGNWILHETPWRLAASTHLIYGWTMLAVQQFGRFAPFFQSAATPDKAPALALNRR